jgi:hypothetical protein
MRFTCLFTQILLAALFCAASQQQNLNKPPTPDASGTPSAPSLALSPAVIMIRTAPGTSSTQTLTITNLTYTRFKFVLEALDVVVRDGQRTFVPAGETDGGIARSAVFDPSSIELDPGGSAQAKVTLTVPSLPTVRAVVALFHGQTALPENGSFVVTGSLGALITYNLSDNVAVQLDKPTVSLQTESSNLTVSEQLENDGTEPVIPKGTLAILNSSGELKGRVAIEPHRLLPGEKFNCSAEYPHNLPPGNYRAMMSFEHEGGVQTSSVAFELP